MTSNVLDDRALNRATLARQLLLERTSIEATRAIEQLVGLQAQNPLDPYVALWSRLAPFDPSGIGRLVEERALVRIPAMRSTIHLLTASDALMLRPVMQPVLDAELARHSEYGPQLRELDLTPALLVVHDMLAERPMSGRQLREALAARFPDLPAAAVAYAARCKLALVQVPPRGVWGRTAHVVQTPLQTWVGRELDPSLAIDSVVLRYLAAFGPASTADVTTWCRLTGMRAVIERLRPRLAVFRDPRGKELFDLPDAPRPDAQTTAPVRLLPEYDNVLLSHSDRTRFLDDEERRFAAAYAGFKGWVLVDGHVRGVWRIERAQPSSVTGVVVEHLRLDRVDRESVAREATALARLWHPASDTVDVRFVAVT